MLFESGQFQTAVCIFFLASCLGQEQFRVCERDNERNIERVLRASDPNDLRESHRFRYEIFEKEQSRLLMKQDFNDIRDRRVDRERLSELIRRTEPKRVERQTKSDVTRNLNDKFDEERECLRRLGIQDEVRLSDTRRDQRESLRQLNEHDDTNQERHISLTRFDNRNVERRSEDNRKERYEHLRQLDLEPQRLDERSFTPRYDETKQKREQRVTSLRSENSNSLSDGRTRSVVARKYRDNERLSQTQRRFENGEESERHHENSRRLESDHIIRSETLKRREENKQERTIGRRLSNDIRDNRKAEADLSTPSKRETRDVREQSAKSRESQRNVIRFLDDSREDTSRQFNERKIQQDTSIRLENVRENSHEDQRDIRRHSEDNLEARQNILRRYNDNKPERDTSRRSEVGFTSRSLIERESMTRRSLNQFERKLNDREVQRYVNRQSEDNRNEYSLDFKRFDERKTRRDTYGRSEDARDIQRSNEIISQRKQELAQHHDDIRESLRLVHRAFPKERYSSHRSDKNERRFDERQIPNDLDRRLEITRESQRNTVRSSRREHEIKQQRHNRIDRRFEERNIQSDDSSRLIVKRDERHNIMRRFDDHDNIQETLRHLNSREAQVDVTRRLGDDNLRRTDIRISQRARKLFHQRDEIMADRVDRREDRYNRAAQRDISRGLDGARKEYYQMMAQLGERNVRQGLDDSREAQRINGNTYQRERRSIQRHDINREEHQQILQRLNDLKAHRDINRRSEESRFNELKENIANRRVHDEQKSPLSNQYFFQMERENQEKEAIQFNTEHTLTHKQRNSNSNCMIFGQGVILAYVIMKTINGKNDFKNQLFIKLREGLEIIGVF